MTFIQTLFSFISSFTKGKKQDEKEVEKLQNQLTILKSKYLWACKFYEYDEVEWLSKAIEIKEKEIDNLKKVAKIKNPTIKVGAFYEK